MDKKGGMYHLKKAYLIVYIAADGSRHPHSFYGTMEHCEIYAKEHLEDYVTYSIV